MAFHVACPITCRRICECELGNAAVGAGRGFVDGVARVREFLKEPWVVRVGGGGGGGVGRDVGTVQVLVPKVLAMPQLPAPVEDGGEGTVSLQAKRVAMQRQAVAASMAAEDYVRRLEAGGATGVNGDAVNTICQEDQGTSSPKIMCRICYSGEDVGSEKAAKMLSCKMCDKKYHRSCLKIWAEYRDLFHWSSWACPSCRICEVCRRGGDATKLMFCKRCDGAYHCYCQQPPHKNASHGPYLCPKHTTCHSCASTVPGNGLSTRWFLGYTCCDACGRLFVKGNYCPVCLKVYRDSEATPMVCCDVCQQWVHCLCDGISDEKYQQFQADGNLHYKCAACRGDCYQVRDIDDAVRELWKRKDKADRDLIASLRAAAGLPSQEEIFSLSPFSDDEETGPVLLKNDHGRSLKFSVKGLTDKSTKNSKEYGKNSSKDSLSNKKYSKKGSQLQSVSNVERPYQSIDNRHETSSLESCFRDKKIDDTISYGNNKTEIFTSPMTITPGNGRIKSYDCLGSDKNSYIKEAVVNNNDKVPKVYIKGSKYQSLHVKEETEKNATKSEPVKGTKLVIHLGGKNRNLTSSPLSEPLSSQKDQDSLVTNGSKLDNALNIKSSKNTVKLAKVSDANRKGRGNVGQECEHSHLSKSPVLMGKRCSENSHVVETVGQATLTSDEVKQGKHAIETPLSSRNEVPPDTAEIPNTSNSSSDLKPLLKLKFKNPYFEHRSSWAPQGAEEKNSIKGQRSKRKRPSTEKIATWEDDSHGKQHLENSVDEVMDAKILQKLGKGAVGKRVEVHESSDSSWHKGVVSNVIEGTSSISVNLDDGRTKMLELGKHGVRFISQKQKRTRT